MNEIYFIRNQVDFTKTEKKLINYIIENPSSFVHMSIGELAKKVGSSEPTISRFARHCGYKDFKELKNAILLHQEHLDSPAHKLTSSMVQKSGSVLEDLLHYQQFCIEKTISFLDDESILHAVHSILSAKHIYIFAKGASISMAQLLQFRLRRFGLFVTLLPVGSSELFEYMNLFQEDDLVILFGFQKTPKEAQVLLDYQKQIHYKVIYFTSRLYHSSGDSTQEVIPLYVYRGEPTEYHSMAAPSAFIDALVVLIASKIEDSSKDSLEKLYQLKEYYKSYIPR